jgi:hypothetical protein
VVRKRAVAQGFSPDSSVKLDDVIRLPFAVSLAVLTLAVSPAPAVAEAVGTITGFKMSDVDIYDDAGEFLCVVDTSALTAGTGSDICSHAAPGGAGSKPSAASIPVREVADDGQLVVAWGGKTYRLDPFQVDAKLGASTGVKVRCQKLAGRSEMAATRGLGENDCDTK